MIGIAIAVGLILLVALVLASFLQIASRIVCGESVEFGDAYKTAFCGMMLSWILSRLINSPGFEIPLPVELGIVYVIWVVMIQLIIGLAFLRTLLVALLTLVLSFLARWLLVMVVNAIG